MITRTIQCRKLSISVMCAGVFCSIMPDLDVLAFHFGIPYESVWGHRGISHSLFFALLGGFLVALMFYMLTGFLTRKFILLWGIFTLIILSHIALDAMTDGGLGVALFAPFNNTRFFLPWRPIPVAPISLIRLMGQTGRPVLEFELRNLLLPGVIYCIIFGIIKGLNKTPTRGKSD